MERYAPRSFIGSKEKKTKARPAVNISVVTEEDTKGLPVSFWGVHYMQDARTGKVKLTAPRLVSSIPQLLVYLFLAYQKTYQKTGGGKDNTISFVGRSYIEQTVAQTISKNKGEIRDEEWKSVLDIALDIKKGLLDMVVNVPVSEWNLLAVLRRCDARFRSALLAAVEKREQAGHEGKESKKDNLLIALAGTITHLVKKAEDWVTMIAKCQGDWDDIARLNVECDLKFDQKRLKLQSGTFEADLNRYLSARSQRINARLERSRADKGKQAKARNTKKSQQGTLNPRALALNANKRKVDLQPKRMKTKRLSDLPAYSVKEIRGQTKAKLVQAVRTWDGIEESFATKSNVDLTERIPSIMDSDLTPKVMLAWGNVEIRTAMNKAYESSESTDAIRNRVLHLSDELSPYHGILLYLAFNSIFGESLQVREKVQDFYRKYSGLEAQSSSWHHAKQIMRLTGVGPSLPQFIHMLDVEEVYLRLHPDKGVERTRHAAAQQEIQAQINLYHKDKMRQYQRRNKSNSVKAGDDRATATAGPGDDLLTNLFTSDQ